MSEKSETPLNRQLLSNYSNDRKQEFESLTKEYKEKGGVLRVFVRNEAYCKIGTLDPNMFALCTLDKPKDHSEFWDFVRSRKE